MARLAPVVCQGLYPAPSAAIAGILKHLRRPVVPDPRFKVDEVNILDPCAGEAKALVQIAEGLSVSPGHAYTVELNVTRAATIAEHDPGIKLLAPCSFEATPITRHSFSLVYLNSPFDDEFCGGGREEVAFLRRAIDLLVPAGVLVVVCPVHEVFGASRMCPLLDTWFEQLEVYVFPDDCRKYNECAVFGRRRKAAFTDELVAKQAIVRSPGLLAVAVDAVRHRDELRPGRR